MQQIVMLELATVDEIPALAADEVHLWMFERPSTLAPRALSAFAHAEVGRLLQVYCSVDTPPALARNAHGKPHVLDPAGPHFNISHGGQRIALAFARDHAVGVDVEALQRRSASLELAERFFCAAEAAALGALDEADRQAAFVRLWTCKEAVLKAFGRGLAFGLDRLRFELDGTQPRALVEIADEAGAALDWQVRRFDAGTGHAGALAWRGPPLPVRAFRVQPTALAAQ